MREGCLLRELCRNVVVTNPLEHKSDVFRTTPTIIWRIESGPMLRHPVHKSCYGGALYNALFAIVKTHKSPYCTLQYSDTAHNTTVTEKLPPVRD